MNKNKEILLQKFNECIINNDYADTRVDRFLYIKFGLTHGIIRKSLRKKMIIINGNKITANYRLLLNDRVLIYKSLLSKKEINKKNNFLSDRFNKKHEKIARDMVITNKDGLIVINKPYGIPSQGGVNINVSVDSLLRYIKDGLHLTHRLDKNTSGVMLIAKGRVMARRISELFKNSMINKTYYALLSKMPANKSGILELPLCEIEKSNERIVVVAHKTGVKSITKYNVVTRINENVVLIKLHPLTGKKHQLRVHMSHLGCPIIGDRKYGGISSAKLCLYAHSISSEEIGFFNAIPPMHMKFISSII